MKIVGSLSLLVFAACVPAFAPTYYVNLATQVCIAAICASGLNVLVGHAGMIAIGLPVLVGVSAYVYAILITHFAFGHSSALVVTLVSVTALGGAFAPLALRTAGISFMMITMAFGQSLWGLSYRWVSMTGGDNGLSIPSRPTVFGVPLESSRPFYLVALGTLVLALATISVFVNSRLGAALRASKYQPRRLSALGYDVYAIRWIAFSFVSFWCAVAGILFCYFFKYIHPQQLALGSAAEYLLMVIAGGPGTLAGPLLGAAIVVVVRNAVSSYFDRWLMLLGFIFIAVVLFLPDGLAPSLQRLWASRSKLSLRSAKNEPSLPVDRGEVRL